MAAAMTASADGVAPAAQLHPIVGFKIVGHTKVTKTTLGYLAHVSLGDLVGPSAILTLETPLSSSELFKSAIVTLEDAPGGTIVVATLDDKWSWLIAPTLYVLPTNRAVGVGYAENDLGGTDQKLLLYGQL